jgi:hypothetical protein
MSAIPGALSYAEGCERFFSDVRRAGFTHDDIVTVRGRDLTLEEVRELVALGRPIHMEGCVVFGHPEASDILTRHRELPMLVANCHVLAARL